LFAEDGAGSSKSSRPRLFPPTAIAVNEKRFPGESFDGFFRRAEVKVP
jgi:hypothetical protein